MIEDCCTPVVGELACAIDLLHEVSARPEVTQVFLVPEADDVLVQENFVSAFGSSPLYHSKAAERARHVVETAWPGGGSDAERPLIVAPGRYDKSLAASA